MADVGPVNLMGVIFRVTPTDLEPLLGPADSVTIDLRNNDVPISIVGAPAAGDLESGAVPVSHILIDGNSDPIEVTVEYSDDGGASFGVAALANTDEGTITLNQIAGLSSSPDGVSHLFDWVSSTDLPETDTAQARIRITPDDALNQGTPFTTPDFLVNNNQEPVVQSIDPYPPGAQAGSINVTYALADAESDDATVTVTYSIDGGGVFAPATLAKCLPADPGVIFGNEISVLPTSPAGTPRCLQWDSATDLPGLRETSVVLRINVRDNANPQLSW